MSFQITTAFVNQFEANVLVLSQQKDSRFAGAVDIESDANGEKIFVERLGSVTPVKRTIRHGDTPLISTPHSRRMITMYDYEWADLIDKEDRVRLLIDPTSPYAMAAAMSMNRAKDDEIISAASGNAYAGKDGTTTVALPAAQKVAAGAANLTLAKLLTTKETLDAADVDPDEERFIAVAPAMITNLLNTTEVKSVDYNTVKALVQGNIDTFLGFKFIMTNRLAANSTANGHLALAWAKSGLRLAIGSDVKSEIDRRADKSYSTQVYYSMTVGATRIEDEKVVEIDCIGG